MMIMVVGVGTNNKEFSELFQVKEKGKKKEINKETKMNDETTRLRR